MLGNDLLVSTLQFEGRKPYVLDDDGMRVDVTAQQAAEIIDYQSGLKIISADEATRLRAMVQPQRGTGLPKSDMVESESDGARKAARVDEVLGRMGQRGLHDAKAQARRANDAAASDAARLSGHAEDAAAEPAIADIASGLGQRLLAELDGESRRVELPFDTAPVQKAPPQAAAVTAADAKTIPVFTSPPVMADSSDDGLDPEQIFKQLIDVRPAQGDPTISDLKGQPKASAWFTEQMSQMRLWIDSKTAAKPTEINLGAVLTGPEGVGKRFLADIYAQQLFKAEVIKNPDLRIIDVRRLKDEDLSIVQALEAVKDGVIYIENADCLDPETDRFTIKTLAELNRKDGEPVVILSGTAELLSIIDSHWRLKDDFASRVELKPLTADVMLEIFLAEGKKRQFSFDDEAVKTAFGRFRTIGSGTTQHVRDLLRSAEVSLATRLYPNGLPPRASLGKKSLGVITAEDLRVNSPFDADGQLKSRKRLDSLRGQENVKAYADALIANAREDEIRRAEGKRVTLPNLNMTLEGPPGVGKTTVVRMIHDIECDLGYRSGKFVYVTAAELKVGTPGEIARRVAQLFNDAISGSFVIDEAHQLFNDANGKLVLDALLPLMYNHRETTTTRLIGYDLQRILGHDPGMMSRIPGENRIAIKSLSRNELGQVFEDMAENGEYELCVLNDDTAQDDAQTSTVDAALRKLDVERAGKDFGNARAVENLFQSARTKRNLRVQAERAALAAGTRQEPIEARIMPADLGKPGPTPLEMLAEFKANHVNVDAICERLKDLALNAARESRDKSALGNLMEPYVAFVGESGSGRKTVAKFLAKYLNGLAKVASADAVEWNAGELKAAYEGQTIDKVRQKFEDALGKVVIINNLAPIPHQQGFAPEVMTALKSLMDEYRGRIVVAFTFTPEEFDDFGNHGRDVASKIGDIYELNAMTSDEALTALNIQLRTSEEVSYTLAEDAVNHARALFEALTKTSRWANGHTVGQVTRKLISSQLSLSRRAGSAESSTISINAVTQCAQAMGIVPELAEGLPIPLAASRIKAKPAREKRS